MKIITVCPESFGANTYLLISGSHAFVVDPSVSVKAIKNAALSEGASIEGILLTHGHFDHIVSIDTLRSELGIKAMIHQADAPMLVDGRKNAFFTFFGKDRTYAPAEILLNDTQTIPLGEEVIEVISTPGHSKGSVCYRCGDIMITGDTLFSDNIGRCDLWGGDAQELLASLDKLSTFDQSIKIYPGHGTSAILRNALDNVSYFRH